MPYNTFTATAGDNVATPAFFNSYVRDPVEYLKGKAQGVELEGALTIENPGSWGETTYLRLPSLTTSQRDGLPTTAGMLIWNATADEVQYCDGSTWAAVGTGSGTATDNILQTLILEITTYNNNAAPLLVGQLPAGADKLAINGTDCYTMGGAVLYGTSLSSGSSVTIGTGTIAPDAIAFHAGVLYGVKGSRLLTIDVTNGTTLYVGTGSTGETMPSGLFSHESDLYVIGDGGEPKAVGTTSSVGTAVTGRTGAWQTLGTGLRNPFVNNSGSAVAIMDDGQQLVGLIDGDIWANTAFVKVATADTYANYLDFAVSGTGALYCIRRNGNLKELRRFKATLGLS